MIKLLIFDLDGTLLDTIKTIEYYGNKELQKIGQNPISTDNYMKYIGHGMKNLIFNILNHYNINDEEIYNKFLNLYDNNYNNSPFYKTEIFKGVKETLDIIKEMGIKLAVLSNKPDFATKAIINHFFSEKYFEIVYGQREGIDVKPSPVSVFEIMDILNIGKDECLFVGDGETDIQVSKNAEIPSVSVSWGYRPKDELLKYNPDYLINKPEELINIIKKI